MQIRGRRFDEADKLLATIMPKATGDADFHALQGFLYMRRDRTPARLG